MKGFNRIRKGVYNKNTLNRGLRKQAVISENKTFV
jgi:hypothetical protein